MFDMWVYEKNTSQNPQEVHSELFCCILVLKTLQASESISLPMADEWNHSDKTQVPTFNFYLFVLSLSRKE